VVLYVSIHTTNAVWCVVVVSVNNGNNAWEMIILGPSVRKKSKAISALGPHVLLKDLATFQRLAEFSCDIERDFAVKHWLCGCVVA